MSDELTAWVVEQERIAEASVDFNKTAVLVRGCIRCGRTDTVTVYRYGRADQSVCADWEECDLRMAVLHGLGDWRRKPKPDGGQVHA